MNFNESNKSADDEELKELHRTLLGDDYKKEDSKDTLSEPEKEESQDIGKNYQMPIKGGKLLSAFVTKQKMLDMQSKGLQPVAPGTHPSGHPAIDVQGPVDAPVYPIGPGTVTEVNSNPGKWKKQGDPSPGGIFCKIKHEPDDNIVSYYAHLNKVNVTVGEKVTMNTVIGTNGNTGSARQTAAHVHLGVKVNGADVDPLTIINKPIGSFKKASKAERIYKVACYINKVITNRF